ncbi:hypothetical protein ACQVEG_004587 [Escherichia coli]
MAYRTHFRTEQQQNRRQHARDDTARRSPTTERSERVGEEAEENLKLH